MSLLLKVSVTVAIFNVVHTQNSTNVNSTENTAESGIVCEADSCPARSTDHEILTLHGSSPEPTNDSTTVYVCPNVYAYAFICKVYYADISLLEWTFRLNETSSASAYEPQHNGSCMWSTNDNNYTYTFFTNHDSAGSSSARICETKNTSLPDHYRLIALVTQDKNDKNLCCEPYYTSILVVEPLGSDTVRVPLLISPFTVSCLTSKVNIITTASMEPVRNKTIHHRFIGDVNMTQLNLNLQCTMEIISSSRVIVNASWSPPENPQSAGLVFYHVVLFSKENETSESIALNYSATLYTGILPSHDDNFQVLQYSASIIAENKCGQMSVKFTVVCKSSRSNGSYRISIRVTDIIVIALFVYTFISA